MKGNRILRILIIEDDEEMRSLLKDSMGEERFKEFLT
jgi:DNA-binding response OmpR family regulator